MVKPLKSIEVNHLKKNFNPIKRFFILGGKICLDQHFKPLFARNVPGFGIAHVLKFGLSPWLAIEVPQLIEKKIISYKEK